MATQADVGGAHRLSTGFTAGIARSGQVNKAELRQATVIASAIAQFISISPMLTFSMTEIWTNWEDSCGLL